MQPSAYTFMTMHEYDVEVYTMSALKVQDVQISNAFRAMYMQFLPEQLLRGVFSGNIIIWVFC